MVDLPKYDYLANRILYDVTMEATRLHNETLGQMAAIRAQNDGSNAWLSQVDTATQLPDGSIHPVPVDAAFFPAEFLGALVDQMIHYKVNDIVAVNTFIRSDNSMRRGLAYGNGLSAGVISPHTWLDVMTSISPTTILKRS